MITVTIKSNAPTGVKYITYYTDDGSTPNSGTKNYIASFTINKTTTIKAVNYYNGNYSGICVKTITIKDTNSSEESQKSKGNSWVFGGISQNLHNLLGTNITSSKLDIYSEENAYKNYINRFILTSDGNTNTNAEYVIPEETFYYQPSEGDTKSVKGLIGYEIGLSNVVKDNSFFLTLTGIHYSKYSYTTTQNLNTKVLRSFVLSPNELLDYNITSYNKEPYFNKMVVTTMGDAGGYNAHQYTSILSFEKTSQNQYKIIDIAPKDDYNKESNGSISVYKGLDRYYDNIREKFSFMFPFGYGHPKPGDDVPELNFKEASINDSKNTISNNKEYNVNGSWQVSSDKDLGGTLAGITEDSVQPADNHLTDIKPDILKESAEIVTGYLT
jgi:hypothetical protein